MVFSRCSVSFAFCFGWEAAGFLGGLRAAFPALRARSFSFSLPQSRARKPGFAS